MVIYHPEIETVQVPVELLERLDRRAARLEVLVLIMKLLIDGLRQQEQSRRWRSLWPVN
ncbi:hypothetical protein ES703_52749 [subsurface metagenome]